MAKRKRYREKIAIHPVMTFLILIVIAIVMSGILALFNTSFSYSAINSVRGEFYTTTESITSLLNLSGIKYIFSNTVSNFANFTVLSHLIIILLGIGIMEYSGFLKTAIGLLTKKVRKNVITYVIVLLCILASIMDNLPFIAFIPLVALIYKYGKRNPNVGIVCSFAALTCGYGLSIFFTSVDSSLSSLTVLSAKVLDTGYSISSFSMLFIMIAAILILSFAITYVTENIVVNKLPKYDFEETEVLSEERLTRAQMRGLLFAGIGSIIYLIIFIYNIIPGLPLSGNFLNHTEILYIDKLFGPESFFSNGFVFIVTILFIIWGFLYGIGARTIKNNREFVESLGYSLNGIGKMLVFIFASATFISIFKQTNIGNVIVAAIGNFIEGTKLSGLPLIVITFIGIAIATILVPSSTLRWYILCPTLVPLFMASELSPEFTQIVFRFSESVTMNITPILAYFIVYLAFLEKYNQSDGKIGMKEAFRYQLPYTVLVGVTLFVIILVWYMVGLPLGNNTFPVL